MTEYRITTRESASSNMDGCHSSSYKYKFARRCPHNAMLRGEKITFPSSKSRATRVKKEAPSAIAPARGKQSCRWLIAKSLKVISSLGMRRAYPTLHLNTLDGNGALAVQLIRISVMALLLAVL